MTNISKSIPIVFFFVVLLLTNIAFGQSSLNLITNKTIFYLGDFVHIKLDSKVKAENRFSRVDLWVAIQLPNKTLLFLTDNPFSPYSHTPQPFHKSLEIDTRTQTILDFEVLPGFSGDYTIFALFNQENATLDNLLFTLKSNIAVHNFTITGYNNPGSGSSYQDPGSGSGYNNPGSGSGYQDPNNNQSPNGQGTLKIYAEGNFVGPRDHLRFRLNGQDSVLYLNVDNNKYYYVGEISSSEATISLTVSRYYDSEGVYSTDWVDTYTWNTNVFAHKIIYIDYNGNTTKASAYSSEYPIHSDATPLY